MLTFTEPSPSGAETGVHVSTTNQQLMSSAIPLNPSEQKIVIKAKFRSVGANPSTACFGIFLFKDDVQAYSKYAGSAFEVPSDSWMEQEGLFEGCDLGDADVNFAKVMVLANYTENPQDQILLFKDVSIEAINH